MHTNIPIPDLPPALSSKVCINCDINVKIIKRSHVVLELHERIVSLINKWVSPRKVEADSELCQGCYSKIIEVLQNEENTDKIQRVRGHETVCPICGISGLKVKWYFIKDTNDKQKAIFKHWIAPRQPKDYEKICRQCLGRINIILIKEPLQLDVSTQQHQNSCQVSTKDSEGGRVVSVTEPTAVEKITLPTPKRVKIVNSITCTTQQRQNSSQGSTKDSEGERVVSVTEPTAVEEITLPTPKRLKIGNSITCTTQQRQNSSQGSTKDSKGVRVVPVSQPTIVEKITLPTSKWVKVGCSITCTVCKSNQKSRMTDKTRYDYLTRNKIYIPDYAKSCTKHLHENVVNGWHRNGIFTAKHIEHCISLYKQRL